MLGIGYKQKSAYLDFRSVMKSFCQIRGLLDLLEFHLVWYKISSGPFWIMRSLSKCSPGETRIVSSLVLGFFSEGRVTFDPDGKCATFKAIAGRVGGSYWRDSIGTSYVIRADDDL